MENLFNNIHFKPVVFFLNSENGYYEKEPDLVPFNKLPNDLKVEESQKDFLIKQGANEIIRGRIRNGQYSFFTGLIPLENFQRVYFGNSAEFVLGKKKISLLVFVFSEDLKQLTIYYFNHFYKEVRADRIKFVQDFIAFVRG